jgi:hypothetical protein
LHLATLQITMCLPLLQSRSPHTFDSHCAAPSDVAVHASPAFFFGASLELVLTVHATNTDQNAAAQTSRIRKRIRPKHHEPANHVKPGASRRLHGRGGYSTGTWQLATPPASMHCSPGFGQAFGCFAHGDVFATHARLHPAHSPTLTSATQTSPLAQWASLRQTSHEQRARYSSGGGAGPPQYDGTIRTQWQFFSPGGKLLHVSSVASSPAGGSMGLLALAVTVAFVAALALAAAAAVTAGCSTTARSTGGGAHAATLARTIHMAR